MNNLLKENEAVYVETKEEFEKVYPLIEHNFSHRVEKTLQNVWIRRGGIIYFFESNLVKGTKIITAPEFLARQQPAFVLPERWAVKRTPENYKVINEWANACIHGQICFLWENGFVLFDKNVGYNQPTYHMHITDGYTEITFEQFKEHVLGEKDAISSEDKNVFDVIMDPQDAPSDIEFKWGEAVEVSEHDEGSEWLPSTYIGLHPSNDVYKYVVNVNLGRVGQYAFCRRAQRIKKITQEEAEYLLQKTMFPDQKVEIIS